MRLRLLLQVTHSAISSKKRSLGNKELLARRKSSLLVSAPKQVLSELRTKRLQAGL